MFHYPTPAVHDHISQTKVFNRKDKHHPPTPSCFSYSLNVKFDCNYNSTLKPNSNSMIFHFLHEYFTAKASIAKN